MAFKSWPFCFVKSVSFHWFSSHMVWDGEWVPPRRFPKSSLKNPKLHQREDNSNWQGLLNVHFEGKAILQLWYQLVFVHLAVFIQKLSQNCNFSSLRFEKDKQQPTSFGWCFWWNFKAEEQQKMPTTTTTTKFAFLEVFVGLFFCPICFWVLFGTIFASFFCCWPPLLVRLDESPDISDVHRRDFGWAGGDKAQRFEAVFFLRKSMGGFFSHGKMSSKSYILF